MKKANKNRKNAQNVLEREQRAASAAYSYKGEAGMTETEIREKRNELIKTAETRVEQARKNLGSME